MMGQIILLLSMTLQMIKEIRMKKLLLILLLPILLIGQNNYAIDFELSSSSFIREAVAGYRSGDTEGYISFWIKPESIANMDFICISDEGGGVNFVRFAINSSGYIRTLNWRSGGGASASTVTSTTTVLSAGNNYHIVAGTGTTKHRIWVNGIEQTTAVTGDGVDDNIWFGDLTGADNFIVGKGATTVSFSYYDGIIDEITVGSVSPDQTIVDALYNSGTPKDNSSVTGYVESIRMEEGTGTSTSSTGSLVLDFSNAAWIASPFGWDAGETDTDKGFKKNPTYPKFKN